MNMLTRTPGPPTLRKVNRGIQGFTAPHASQFLGSSKFKIDTKPPKVHFLLFSSPLSIM